MDDLQRARADLERARANLARARDALPSEPELELSSEVPKHRLKAWVLARSTMKAAEHACQCCESLVSIAERRPDPELLKAISQAERATVYASNAVVGTMMFAQLEPEWLAD